MALLQQQETGIVRSTRKERRSVPPEVQPSHTHFAIPRRQFSGSGMRQLARDNARRSLSYPIVR